MAAIVFNSLAKIISIKPVLFEETPINLTRVYETEVTMDILIASTSPTQPSTYR